MSTRRHFGSVRGNSRPKSRKLRRLQTKLSLSHLCNSEESPLPPPSPTGISRSSQRRKRLLEIHGWLLYLVLRFKTAGEYNHALHSLSLLFFLCEDRWLPITSITQIDPTDQPPPSPPCLAIHPPFRPFSQGMFLPQLSAGRLVVGFNYLTLTMTIIFTHDFLFASLATFLPPISNRVSDACYCSSFTYSLLISPLPCPSSSFDLYINI
jgi:hypothetical protein